jgi:hypothetical protein
MALLGFNGGLLGSIRTPTDNAASGLWFQDEQKLAKQAGIWPAAFVNPPGPTTDLYGENVSLLLHMDDVNGSTTFADSSINALTVTADGGAQISTSESKFGGAAGLFDGSNDNLGFPAILIGSTEDVTIEGWIYPTATSDNGIVGDSTGNNMQVMTLLGGRLAGYWNGSTLEGGNVATNTWQHVAITRESGTIRLFVNGVLDGGSVGNTQSLSINTIGKSIYRGFYNGRMDDFRITKGVARYTASFTPPTAAFPNPVLTTDLYPSNVSLLLHMDGSSGSTTFIDSSLKELAVTANGNAQVSTAQSKFGEGSALFDGNGDYLLSPHDLALDLSNGVFTVECWLYQNSRSTDQCILVKDGIPFSTYPSYALRVDAMGAMSFHMGAATTGGSTQHLVGTLPLATWTHVAISVTGGQIKTYMNGVNSLSESHGTIIDAATAFAVGSQHGFAGTGYDGYIDELRITKGVARYAASFTLNTDAFPDPVPTVDKYGDNVSLLLHMDGSNGNTTFTDNSNNVFTVTANGDVQISTTQSKYGGASGYFDGSGDYLSIADDAAFDFGNEDFTIEFWFYLTAGATGGKALISKGTWPSGVASFLVYYGGGSELGFYASTGNGTWDITNLQIQSTPSKEAWHHVAITRSGNVFRGFFNGMKEVEQTYSITLDNNTSPVTIGSGAAGASAINAYIDDLRITKGVARYTANFTPPTTAFLNPTDQYINNVSLLLHMNGSNGSTTFTDSSINTLTVTASGDAQITTTDPKFGTGSLLLDGGSDYITIGPSSALQLGGSDFTVECWVYANGGNSNDGLFTFGDTTSGLAVALENGNWRVSVVGASYFTHTVAVTTGVWTHLAVTRYGTALRFFVNGVSAGSVSDSSNFIQDTLKIGYYYSADYAISGKVDEFRVTKGIARYITNFTPPTAPFQGVNPIPIASIAYSQSSVYSGVSPADNATMTNGSFVDSRTATSANGILEWVQMDLGDIYQVGSVVIGAGTSNVPGGWNKSYSENRDIEYSSDGTNWTYAFTTPGIHGAESTPNTYPDNGIYTYPVNFTARYIRFSKGAGSGNWVLISEFYALAPGQIYDPYSDNVSLLLHMDGSNGSTTFTDSSGNAIAVTGYGNAQISTAQSRFGGSSAYFDGSGDYLSTASSLAPFQMGTGDFTVEAFIRPTGSGASSGYKGLIGLEEFDTDTLYMLSGTVLWYNSGTAAGVIAADTWYHVAASRQGTTLRVFLDGVLVNTSTNSNNMTFGRLRVGSNGPSTGEFFQGWIDELRITKSVARYTANFTPPTAPFPNPLPSVPPAPSNPIPALSPVFWYDFADESTVTTSGTAITSVTDKGSRGWALSVGGTSPQYVTGINGKKCLDWGASPVHSNFMYHANNDGTPITIGEVYVVVDAAFGGTAGNYAGLLTAHNGNWYVLAVASSLTEDGTGFDQLFINGGTSNKFSGGLFGSPSIDDPAIMRTNNSSGNTIFSSSGIQIGNDRNNSNLNRGWSGLIGEYVIFPSVLSPTDRNAVQAWLAAKWGITLS